MRQKNRPSPEMRIGAAVRQARIAAGFTQVELAKQAGIVQQTLSNLERGITHRTSYVHEIAKALGITVEEMLSGLPDHVLQTIGDGARAAFDLPVYGTEDRKTVPAWWLWEIEKTADQLVLYRVQDSAMAPRIQVRDYLVIDTHDRAIHTGQVYGIEAGGSLLIRRAQVRVDGALRLHTERTTETPEDIPPARAAKLAVLGRVIWVSGAV